MTRDELQKTVHQALNPFLFEPNTVENRAEMVAILEEIPGMMVEDMTTDFMVMHGAVRFDMSDGFKSYRVEFGPGCSHVKVEERRV